MKNICDCICPQAATPMNTVGMGDVNPITGGEPLVTKKKKKRQKMKNLKDYIISEARNKANAFCILKPEFDKHEQEWLDYLKQNNWQILNKKSFTMDKSIAQDLYSPHKDKDFYNDLCDYMSSGNCTCCSCHKECDNPIEDMAKLKDEIRKRWGKSEMKNAMHSSDSIKNVNRESKIIFG